MFTRQLKSEFIMIEIIPEPIHPVMTFETIFSERNLVIHHESHIDTGVTLSAGHPVELRDIIPMAICAQERFILNCELVTL